MLLHCWSIVTLLLTWSPLTLSSLPPECQHDSGPGPPMVGGKVDKTKVMLGYLTAVTGSMNNRQVSSMSNTTSLCSTDDWCPQLKCFVTHIKFLSSNVLIEAQSLLTLTHIICRCVHTIVGRVRQDPTTGSLVTISGVSSDTFCTLEHVSPAHQS